MENQTVLGILVAVLVIGLIAQGVVVANSLNREVSVTFDENQIRSIVSEEVSKISVGDSELVSELVIPTAAEIAAEINVESADNVLLNEFLESEFSVQYLAIETAAEPFALEELEDHDYRVVVDYLKSLLSEGEELDEDEVYVYVDKTEVEVTLLGLGEDADKSARVTYEIEVEYELEEGVRDEFEKDLVVVYDVLFEEGILDEEHEDFEEEVELVSIA